MGSCMCQQAHHPVFFGLQRKASLMGSTMSSGVQLSGPEFWVCHLLTVWSWASCSISALPVSKMGEMV